MKYMDLQVNGAFGIDFNDDAMTTEGFEFACSKLRQSGVAGFLATIITDSIETMCSRIQKIVRMLEAKPELGNLVRGIHVEGPFLSDRPGYFGTHPVQHIVPANLSNTQRLLDAGSGWIRMVTLAPEQDPDCQVIQRLCNERVRVFAGHTDASITVLKRAIDNGLIGFTHLGNGCVHQVERHDNIIQRVLALRERLYITLIADGIHLPKWLLQSWLGIIGCQRCIIISDSMSAAGMPPGEYKIGNQNILVEPTRRTRHRDHDYLAGSASTMQDMDRILSESLAICEADRNRCMLNNASSLLLRGNEGPFGE